MREIEYREIKSYKCQICGCRNKFYHELFYPENIKIGYHYRCCNCGSEHISTNPDVDMSKIPNNSIIHSNYICMMQSECRNYNCRFNKRSDNPYQNEDSDTESNLNGAKHFQMKNVKTLSVSQLTFKSGELCDIHSTCDKFR